jgi:RNA polymerase sigma-70 factor (ECF subfamily)
VALTAPYDDDRHLVVRARSGDQSAFGELVTRYQRPLMAKALRSTRQLEDADDLVQETFLRAWRALSTFREDDRFGGWLFRILTNLLIDRGRVLGREQPMGNEVGVELSDPAQRPDEALLAAEITDAVQRALESLPPGRQRQIFELRFVQHLPVQAIAETLGVHSGTVKVHLFRGAKELRRVLAEWQGVR